MPALTTIPTFTDGTVPTAAQLNTMGTTLDVISQDTVGAGVFIGRVYRPAGRAELTALQSIPDSTDTVLTWDMSTLNTDGNFALIANSNLTCNTPGWYRVTLQVAWQSVAGQGERAIQVLVNGTANSNVVASSNTVMGASNNQRLQVVTYQHLTLHDNVLARVFQSSGAAVSVLPPSSASASGAAWGTWMTFVYEAPY